MGLTLGFQGLALKNATNGKNLRKELQLTPFCFRKKMNFTTDLPKRNPLVSYIVASAVRCEKFFPDSSKPGPVYRMHAVILKENGIKLNTNP